VSFVSFVITMITMMMMSVLPEGRSVARALLIAPAIDAGDMSAGGRLVSFPHRKWTGTAFPGLHTI